ncbi:retrovirus-related pol polyprotein from transposon TNT 1-94 [Tanacetum coccineum]|uniref:Retrovirus-related pol polyprotein from transposon TNT 1-94 n=1 Tax=Tanacetum coccineum TaxID=301880 RepID=A0ABQ4X5T3_9ASTR
MDDLYYNFKIVEQKIKKSVGASSGAQNLAFMTAPRTSSTNYANTLVHKLVTTSLIVNAGDTKKFKEGVQFRKIKINTRKQETKKKNLQKAMLLVMIKILYWSDDGRQNKFQTNRPKAFFHDSENEFFSKEVVVLKREVACKDYEINVLKSEFEKVKQEKDDIEFKIEKFDKASKDLDQLLGREAYGGRITGKGTLKTDSLDFKDILLKIPRKDNMYSFDMKNIVPKESLTCLVAKATLDETMLWHRRLGHINFKNINKLVKDNLVRGLPTKRFENDQTCVACLKGKQHRASCLTWYYLLTKDETSEIFKNFIKEIENLVDKKVKIIKSDNGTEFKNKVMDDFCREKGIKRKYSVSRTPQQNGVVERRNKTLIEAARTMDTTLNQEGKENLHIEFLEKKPMIEDNVISEKKSVSRLALCANLKDTSYFDLPTKDVENGEPKTADDAQKQVEDSPNNENIELTSIAKALSDSSWVEAMQEELLQFKLQQVWILVDLPSGKRAIGGSFRTRKMKGAVIRNKSKVVVVVEFHLVVQTCLVLKDEGSRQDIMFAVCACARFQVTPKTSHLLAVKRIFRYLKGKQTLGLWYSRDSSFELVAYTDSDYAGATQDRKSTTRAEYVGAASCCGQVLWIQNQLMDYGYNFMNTMIHIDLLTKGFDAESVKTLDNGEIELIATVDGHEMSITEASVKRHLKLADADGISTLPTTEIFEQLALMRTTRTRSRRMGIRIPQSNVLPHVTDEALTKEMHDGLGRATTTASSLEAEQGSGNISKTQTKATPSRLSSLRTSSESGPGEGNTSRSGEGSMQLLELMEICTKLLDMVTTLEDELRSTKAVYNKSLITLTKRVKRLENKLKLKRRRSTIVHSLEDEEASLDIEDPSKQGRMIEEIDQDKNVNLVKSNKQGEAHETADHGMESDVDFSTASPQNDDDDEITLAETLVNIKRSAVKDKGKAIMQESEPPKKIKKRVQVQMSIDEELAKNVFKEEQARFNTEQEARFKAEQEQEKIDFETALELQKQLDEREEVASKSSQAHDID